MSDTKYCSARFKTGEELDAALAAALDCCDEAAKARSAADEAAGYVKTVVANATVAATSAAAAAKSEENATLSASGAAYSAQQADQASKDSLGFVKRAEAAESKAQTHANAAAVSVDASARNAENASLSADYAYESAEAAAKSAEEAKNAAGSGGGSGGIVNADLDENDETKPGYVKNRTHWRECLSGGEYVVPEMDVAFTRNVVNVTGAIVDGLVVGDTYIVTWNGVEYECVCKKNKSSDAYLGNGFLGANGGEDTGEPFVVNPYSGGTKYYNIYKKTSTTETIRVKVRRKPVFLYHKLAKEYLPDDIGGGGGGGVSSWNDLTDKPFGSETATTVLFEQELDFNSGTVVNLHNTSVDLVAGETYDVYWNGEKYSCVAQYHEDTVMPTLGLGNGDIGSIWDFTGNGEPFLLVVMLATENANPTTAVMVEESGQTVYMTVSQDYESVKTLDSKYLPEHLALNETVRKKTHLDVPNLWLRNQGDTYTYDDIQRACYPFPVGENCEVVWNGETYTCQVYTKSGQDRGRNYVVTVIGNVSVDSFAPEFSGNGEPFGLVHIDWEYNDEYTPDEVLVYSHEKLEVISVTVSSYDRTNTIDGNYLPEVSYSDLPDKPFCAEFGWYPVFEDLEFSCFSPNFGDPNVEVKFRTYSSNKKSFPSTRSNVAKAIIDGIEYGLTTNNDKSYHYDSDGRNSMRFEALDTSVTLVAKTNTYYRTGDKIRISYYAWGEVVTKIDKKFLPENEPPSWYDLTDKPFGDNADGTVNTIDPKYLPELGGGASYWAELKAKPFYATAGEVVLEEQCLVTDDEGVVGTMGLQPIGVVAGDLYVIKWNGVEYACEGVAIEFEGLSCVVCGNLALLKTMLPSEDGEEPSEEEAIYAAISAGEPFLALFFGNEIVEAMNVTAQIMVLDGSEEVTFAVHKPDIHPLDSRYIVLTSPNGTQYNLSVADDGTLSAVPVT